MKIEKVIFDTNRIYNKRGTDFFLGKREELKKFTDFAEIIIPEMVINEIESQKKKFLEEKKQHFLENPFFELAKLDRKKIKEIKKFDINTSISDLKSEESITYTTIKLSNSQALEKIKKLALDKRCPFKENDSGFKDAYIYFTILDYLEENPKKIFFCTEDDYFKKVFRQHNNIKIIKDFNDFKKEIVDNYKDDYFIEKLKIIDENINPKNIISIWENYNENKIILVTVINKEYRIEIDSREILYHTDINIKNNVNELINCGTYKATKKHIQVLNENKNFLSEDEILNIFKATTENSQIFDIIDDTIVKDFISTLFTENKKIIVDNNLKNKLKSILKIID